jgi:hypothetical protein
MRPALLIAILLALPAQASPRAPSCEVLLAYGFGMGAHLIERSFGIRLEQMSEKDFSNALDVVQTCIDTIGAQPPDPPGLPFRERKIPQISVLSVIAEEIRFHRTRAQDRDANSMW